MEGEEGMNEVTVGVCQSDWIGYEEEGVSVFVFFSLLITETDLLNHDA